MKHPSHWSQRYSRMKLPGGTLFWQEVGTGSDTLVLLHGSWNDSGQWSSLLPFLAGNYHCLAPDLLGFGESQGVFPAYSVELQVETLAAFLEALRIQSCYLVGHSLGAWVASCYAQRYPQQVKGLVVMAPEGSRASLQPRRWRSRRWLAGRFSLAALFLQLGAPLMRLLGGSSWLRSLAAQRQQLRAFPATCQMLFSRRSAAIQAEAIAPLPPQLPVLLLASSTPTATEVMLSNAFLALAPTAAVEDLPATAAGLDPAAVAQALRHFCQPGITTSGRPQGAG